LLEGADSATAQEEYNANTTEDAESNIFGKERKERRESEQQKLKAVRLPQDHILIQHE